jgi:hypothetical protein
MKRMKQKENKKKEELKAKQNLKPDGPLPYSEFMKRLHEKEESQNKQEFRFTYKDLLEDIRKSS